MRDYVYPAGLVIVVVEMVIYTEGGSEFRGVEGKGVLGQKEELVWVKIRGFGRGAHTSHNWPTVPQRFRMGRPGRSRFLASAN